MTPSAYGRQGGGGSMECDHVIVAIFAIGVMNHGLSMAEHPNLKFTSWEFGRRTNKIITPLHAFQSVEIKRSPLE